MMAKCSWWYIYFQISHWANTVIAWCKLVFGVIRRIFNKHYLLSVFKILLCICEWAIPIAHSAFGYPTFVSMASSLLGVDGVASAVAGDCPKYFFWTWALKFWCRNQLDAQWFWQSSKRMPRSAYLRSNSSDFSFLFSSDIAPTQTIIRVSMLVAYILTDIVDVICHIA